MRFLRNLISIVSKNHYVDTVKDIWHKCKGTWYDYKDTWYEYKVLIVYVLVMIVTIYFCCQPPLEENFKKFIIPFLGTVISLCREFNEIQNGNRVRVCPPDYNLKRCNEKSKKWIDNVKDNIRFRLDRDACKKIGKELDSFIEGEIHDNRFIYFLRGEPGVGKSTFLALKAETWQNSEHFVAYVSGTSIEDKEFKLDSTILDLFIEDTKQGNIENLFKKLNTKCNKKKLRQKFILIIDSFNKSCDLNKIFVDLLKNYAPLLKKYPWIRVIISINNEFIYTYKKSFIGGDQNSLFSAYLYTYNLENKEIGAELSMLSTEECSAMYNQLKEQKDNSSATNWNELPEDIKTLLNSYEFIYLFFSNLSGTTKPIGDIYSLMNLWKEEFYKKSERLKMAVATIVEQLIENTPNDINKENPYIGDEISYMKKKSILTEVVVNGRLSYNFSSEHIANVFLAEYIQNKITEEQDRFGHKNGVFFALNRLKGKTSEKLLSGLVYYLKESIFKLKDFTSPHDKKIAIEIIFESLCCLDYQLPPHSSHFFTHGRARSAYEIRTLFELELENIDHPHKDKFLCYNSYEMSLALIRMDLYDDAIHRLEKLSKQNVVSKVDTDFKVAIEVYLALAHMSKGEYTLAEKILEGIKNRRSSVESSRQGNLGATILWQLKLNTRTPFPKKYREGNKERFEKVEKCFNTAITLAKNNNDHRSLSFWSCCYGYYIYLTGNKNKAKHIFHAYKELCEKDKHGNYYFNSFFGEILYNSPGLMEQLEGGRRLSNSEEKRPGVDER